MEQPFAQALLAFTGLTIMAMKSSKIAVTLEPNLKQKLREYGKENQIKNFSGVILAILDEYFGASDTPSSPPADLWQTIRELTTRVEQLEAGMATTEPPKEKPKKVIKTKASVKPAAAKPKVSKLTAAKTTKVAKPDKPTKPVKKATAAKTAARTSSKSPANKAKSTRAAKVISKAAPVKKTKATSTRKSQKAKASKNQWMSTREAFDMYGGALSWSRFSKLTPEELKERFNLDSDLSRKVRGSRFNQWLTLGS